MEVAIALVDGNGQIQDEFATLINPGRDTGPVFIHGISNDAVRNAPTFAEIVPELLARLASVCKVGRISTFVHRPIRCLRGHRRVTWAKAL